MNNKVREITEEETRNEFLSTVKGLINYWNKLEGDYDTEYRLDGLAFSILTLLDGCSNMPQFIIAPKPHPDDKEYHIENGENYYPENQKLDVKCDIGGCLHEYFSQIK